MAIIKSKKTSISPLEKKVTDLIYKLLEEKTLEKRRSQEGSATDNAFDDIFFAKDLTLNEVNDYCLARDLSLQRVKRAILQRSVEKVLKEIRAEEKQEFSAYPEFNEGNPGGNDSNNNIDTNDEEEALRRERNLMSTPNNNDMNRSITSLWSLGQPDSAVDSTEESGTPKKKRNTKEGPTKVKRQKTKTVEDRSPPMATLDKLGGMDDVVAQLMELIGLPILHPEIYVATGIEPPCGVLLHGPPGCGKTSIAYALAGELKVPFIPISAPSIVSGMSGESEKRIRDLFEEAKSLAPCLMFFDEIDAITPKRDGAAQREMERRIVAQLLSSMDELSMDNNRKAGKPVIVIGATNRPDALDAALRRAGRFDREICLSVPNEISRLHILKKMTQNLKLGGSVDFSKLAKLTPGFVGADLKALITAAGTCAIKRIFSTYGTQTDSTSLEDTMDVDSNELSQNGETAAHDGQENLKNTANMIDPMPLSVIQRFIKRFPEPLEQRELDQLSIKYEDFLKALPTIQPTAKREGFATVPDVTWANVGALEKVRIELNLAIVQPIKRPEMYERVGINAPAGVLLWGPPGCGKTLLAKAVANESRANFISIKGPELLNKYVGESERAIRQVFSRARASVPCIIFFDELDALVPRRDSSLSESSSRVVNTLLTELDGLNDRHGIFVIGATNRPDMIDPAMLRPGRLDKTLFIELPNELEKLDILKTLTKSNGTPLDKDVDFDVIVKDERCRNFSGADLAALIRESSIIALKRNFFQNNEIQSIAENDLDKEFEDLTVGSPSDKVIVTMDDFWRALKKIKPSVSDKDRSKYERLNRKMGWMDEDSQDEGNKEQNVGTA